jgi:hypothetical protein
MLLRPRTTLWLRMGVKARPVEVAEGSERVEVEAGAEVAD